MSKRLTALFLFLILCMNIFVPCTAFAEEKTTLYFKYTDENGVLVENGRLAPDEEYEVSVWIKPAKNAQGMAEHFLTAEFPIHFNNKSVKIISYEDTVPVTVENWSSDIDGYKAGKAGMKMDSAFLSSWGGDILTGIDNQPWVSNAQGFIDFTIATSLPLNFMTAGVEHKMFSIKFRTSANGGKVDFRPATSADEYYSEMCKDGFALFGGNVGAAIPINFDVVSDADVYIHIPVTGVSIEEPSIDLIQNGRYQFNPRVEPLNATNPKVIYKSSNEEVATVTSDGIVTAKSGGTAEITVTTEEGGYTDSCIINVFKDEIAPEITYVYPGNNATVSNETVMYVNTSDNYKLSKVILEKDNGGVWEKVKEVPVSGKKNTAQFSMKGIQLDATNMFRVYALDAAENQSEPVVVNYTLDLTPPIIFNIQTEATISGAVLSWECTDEDLNGFYVYTSTDGVHFSPNTVASKGKNSEGKYSVNVTGLNPENVYYFKIIALDINKNKSEAISNSVQPLAPVPVAVMQIPECLSYGELGEFDASASVGTGLTYEWDFGNGASSGIVNDSRLQYKYIRDQATVEDIKEFTVTLNITDKYGRTDSISKKVTVSDASKFANLRVKVTDENGRILQGATVVLDPDSDGRIVLRTDSDGYAFFSQNNGVYDYCRHDVNVYKEGYLPKSWTITLKNAATTESTVVLEKGEVAVGELESKPITADEAIELADKLADAGIDINDTENRHIYEYSVEIKVDGKDVTGKGYYLDEPYGSYSDYKVVRITDWSDQPSGDGDYVAEIKREYIQIEFDNLNDVSDQQLGNAKVGVLIETPGQASWLKEFFDVKLTFTNQSAQQFFMSNCVINLVTPDGLTVMTNAIGSNDKVVNIEEKIYGGEQKEVKWILRGDKEGKYEIKAELSGTVHLGNNVDVPFNTVEFKNSNPIEVFGSRGMKFVVEAEEKTTKYDDYVFRLGLKNDGEIVRFFPQNKLDTSLSNEIEEISDEYIEYIENANGTREKKVPMNERKLDLSQTLYSDYKVALPGWTYNKGSVMEFIFKSMGGEDKVTLPVEFKVVPQFSFHKNTLETYAINKDGKQTELKNVQVKQGDTLKIAAYLKDVYPGTSVYAPVKGSEIYLLNTAGEKLAEKTTDNQGMAEFEYTVPANKTGHIVLTVKGNRAEEHTFAINVIEVPNKSSIKGTVYDTQRNILSGVSVNMDGLISGATTDENGVFEFTEIDTREYLISLEKDGYYSASINKALEPGENVATFVLRQKPKITTPKISKIESNMTSNPQAKVYIPAGADYDAEFTVVCENSSTQDIPVEYEMLVTNDATAKNDSKLSTSNVISLNLSQLSAGDKIRFRARGAESGWGSWYSLRGEVIDVPFASVMYNMKYGSGKLTKTLRLSELDESWLSDSTMAANWTKIKDNLDTTAKVKVSFDSADGKGTLSDYQVMDVNLLQNVAPLNATYNFATGEFEIKTISKSRNYLYYSEEMHGGEVKFWNTDDYGLYTIGDWKGGPLDVMFNLRFSRSNDGYYGDFHINAPGGNVLWSDNYERIYGWQSGVYNPTGGSWHGTGRKETLAVPSMAYYSLDGSDPGLEYQLRCNSETEYTLKYNDSKNRLNSSFVWQKSRNTLTLLPEVSLDMNMVIGQVMNIAGLTTKTTENKVRSLEDVEDIGGDGFIQFSAGEPKAFSPIALSSEGMEFMSLDGSDEIVASVYQNAYKSADDGMIVYIGENQNKGGNINGADLMYAVYNAQTGEWEEKGRVDSDNTADFMPDVVKTADGYAAIWVDSLNSYQDSEFENANAEKANDFAASMGISAAVYKNGVWTKSVIKGTSTGTRNQAPKLVKTTDGFAAVWIEDKADYNVNPNSEPAEVLAYSIYNGFNWSEPKQLTNVGVSDFDLIEAGGNVYMIFRAPENLIDKENENQSHTINKYRISKFMGDAWTQPLLIDEHGKYNENHASFVLFNNTAYVAYISNGTLNLYNITNEKVVYSTDISALGGDEEVEIIADDDKLVLVSSSDGGSIGAMCYYPDSKEVTGKIVIAEPGENEVLGDINAYIAANGILVTTYNKYTIATEGEDYGITNVAMCSKNVDLGGGSVIVKSIDVANGELVNGTEMLFDVVLKNTSLNKKAYDLKLYANESSEPLAVTNLDPVDAVLNGTALLPGEEKTVQLKWVVTGAEGLGNISFKAAFGESSAKCAIVTKDISIEGIDITPVGKQASIVAKIKNSGYVPLDEYKLAIYREDGQSRVLVKEYSFNTAEDKIPAGVTVTKELENIELAIGEYEYVAEVTITDEEIQTDNNKFACELSSVPAFTNIVFDPSYTKITLKLEDNNQNYVDYMDDAIQINADDNSFFYDGLDEGNYQVIIDKTGYLNKKVSVPDYSFGETRDFNGQELMYGDLIKDQDKDKKYDIIDCSDLAYLIQLQNNASYDETIDSDGNGVIDLKEYAALVKNYGAFIWYIK